MWVQFFVGLCLFRRLLVQPSLARFERHAALLHRGLKRGMSHVVLRGSLKLRPSIPASTIAPPMEGQQFAYVLDVLMDEVSLNG
ncbi:hypothetical protein EV363DRAFT_1398443 [Boletus edulis]|nr:hypothetical protein EV363DRAFT_1398443 [Boletus edulis]